jgi:hypothetical protein
MAMNCKQFKHAQRVEKKQQFSFNPAEINYEEVEFDRVIKTPSKPNVRDLSLKKLIKYIVFFIVIISLINALF